MHKTLIINTGGTFSKAYDKKLQKFIVTRDNNQSAESIVSKCMAGHEDMVDIHNVIFKDSLHVTDEDRKLLINIIAQKPHQNVVVIHGTDTIDLTARFIERHFKNNPRLKQKKVVLTGALSPYDRDPHEAVFNLSSAYTASKCIKKPGVYIAVDGFIGHHTCIQKNKKEGVFVESDDCRLSLIDQAIKKYIDIFVL